jgi:hypothetical protein
VVAVTLDRAGDTSAPTDLRPHRAIPVSAAPRALAAIATRSNIANVAKRSRSQHAFRIAVLVPR